MTFETDSKVFLATVDGGRTIAKYTMNQIVFAQGDAADAVFFVEEGKVKVTVVSDQGKEAVAHPTSDEKGSDPIVWIVGRRAITACMVFAVTPVSR